jgi:hypothetical protein
MNSDIYVVFFILSHEGRSKDVQAVLTETLGRFEAAIDLIMSEVRSFDFPRNTMSFVEHPVKHSYLGKKDTKEWILLRFLIPHQGLLVAKR